MSKFVYFLTYISFYVYLCNGLMVASVASGVNNGNIARFNSSANLLRGLIAPILFSYIAVRSF